MPRSLPTLTNELRTKVWQPASPLLDANAAAQAWADAYGVYAQDALGCATPPAPGQVDAAKVRLKNGMVTAFSGTVAASTASGIQAAFIAFWTGFLFTGAPVAIPGTPTLAGLLTSQWGNNPSISSVDAAVAAHAGILHSWSNTVVTGLPCNAPIA